VLALEILALDITDISIAWSLSMSKIRLDFRISENPITGNAAKMLLVHVRPRRCLIAVEMQALNCTLVS
jgi:hypothetical protein